MTHVQMSVPPILKRKKLCFDSFTSDSEKHQFYDTSAPYFCKVTPQKPHAGLPCTPGVSHSTPLHSKYHENTNQEHHQSQKEEEPFGLHMMSDQPLNRSGSTNHGLSFTPTVSEFCQDDQTFLPVRFQRLNACLPFLNPRLSMTSHIMGFKKLASRAPFLMPG